MIRTKRRVVVSISYFDFDFGDDLIAANAFAKYAKRTIMDQSRDVHLTVGYLPDGDIEEDKEEEQHDQTTD